MGKKAEGELVFRLIMDFMPDVEWGGGTSKGVGGKREKRERISVPSIRSMCHGRRRKAYVLRFFARIRSRTHRGIIPKSL